MEYDAKKVGERLKQVRIEMGYKNQTDFCENFLLCGRNKLSDCESGKDILPLDCLIRICKAHNCELGYLLCEIDCKTRQVSDIQDKIKLSEKSIERLLNNSNLYSGNVKAMQSLDALILNDDFIQLLIDLSDYKENLYEMLSNGENEKMKYELFKMQTSFIRIVDAITELQKNKEKLNRRKRLF